MIFAHEQQQLLSRSGTAVNQCPACGTFRVDSQPPTVHRTDCGLGPDGSQIGVLRTDGGRWRERLADREARR